MENDVITWREVLQFEDLGALQRGMNFRIKRDHSIILMSVRRRAPYVDRVLSDGITIEYEGHDIPRYRNGAAPKSVEQPVKWPNGGLTQNGLFVEAIDSFKNGREAAEVVHVYNKIADGIWSFQGRFHLMDYNFVFIPKEGRRVYRFRLRLLDDQAASPTTKRDLPHNRVIPTEVKVAVWKRDHGMCVKCGSKNNLHFDHDIPFSKGGSSIVVDNVKLMCARHNLQKSDRIE
jgi:hypothetical protein